MSNLTDLLPAGAGGKQVSFVASGTLANGQTVAINSDGTVEAVGDVSEVIGTEDNFIAETASWLLSTYDKANNKIVVVYQPNSTSYGTAAVGTISGGVISFGTPVVFNTTGSTYSGICYHEVENVITIGYYTSGVGGSVIAGVVSGDSISFGTPVVFDADASDYYTKITSTIDPSLGTNRVFVGYKKVSDGYGYMTSAAVQNGTTLGGFTTPVVFESNSLSEVLPVFHEASRSVLIIYRSSISSSTRSRLADYNASTVGSVTDNLFNGQLSTSDYVAAYDPETKTIIAGARVSGTFYVDQITYYGNSFVGYFQTRSQAISSQIAYMSGDYDPKLKKFLFVFRNNATNLGNPIGNYVIEVSVINQSAITIGTFYPYSTQLSYSETAVFDPVTNTLGAVFDSPNGVDTTVISPSYNNLSDFIGITDAAISDTASGSVTIKGGISTNVTGLTPNATYYVKSDGSLATTSSSDNAGKALSSTSINLDYTS